MEEKIFYLRLPIFGLNFRYVYIWLLPSPRSAGRDMASFPPIDRLLYMLQTDFKSSVLKKTHEVFFFEQFCSDFSTKNHMGRWGTEHDLIYLAASIIVFFLSQLEHLGLVIAVVACKFDCLVGILHLKRPSCWGCVSQKLRGPILRRREWP